MSIISLLSGFSQSNSLQFSMSRFDLQNTFSLPSTIGINWASDDIILWDRNCTLYNITDSLTGYLNTPSGVIYPYAYLQFFYVVNPSTGLKYPQFFMALAPCTLEYILVGGGGAGGTNSSTYVSDTNATGTGGGGGGGGQVLQGQITVAAGELFGVTVGGSGESTSLSAYFMENNQLRAQVVGLAQAGGSGGSPSNPNGTSAGTGGGASNIGGAMPGSPSSPFLVNYGISLYSTTNLYYGNSDFGYASTSSTGGGGGGAGASTSAGTVHDTVSVTGAPGISTKWGNPGKFPSLSALGAGGAGAFARDNIYDWSASDVTSSYGSANPGGGSASTFYGQPGRNRSGGGGGASSASTGAGAGGSGVAIIGWKIL